LIPRPFVSLALTVWLALLAGGCGAIFGQRTDPDLWSPFESESSWTVDDGTLTIRVSGFVRGHSPGLTSTFRIWVENQTAEPLDNELCLYLIDERAVVQEIHRTRLELEATTGSIRLIRVTFDEELEARAYGFAVVLDGWGATVSTVRLGVADAPAGPWLDSAELSCRPEVSNAAKAG
jgi:hypothetical protein